MASISRSGNVKTGPATIDRLSFLGPPPLVCGEDADAYDKLFASVYGAVKPTDVIENFWVHDIVDLV